MERALWTAVRRALLMTKTEMSPTGQRAAQLVIDAIGLYLKQTDVRPPSPAGEAHPR